MFTLTKKDLQRQLNTDNPLVDGPALSYSPLNYEQEMALIDRLLERIPKFTKTGDPDKWERCWGDVLKQFTLAVTEEEALKALFPPYLKDKKWGDDVYMRLDGHYVLPETPNFEAEWYLQFARWLFGRFEPFHHIVEFGCGSGLNLALLSLMYPLKKITGCDWSPSAVQLVDAIHTRFHTSGESHRVDFFDPPDVLPDLSDAAVLTVGALEQTGKRWQTFLDWLIARKPALVVHVEPIADFWHFKDSVWVDGFITASPFDQVMLRFMEHRNYWSGYFYHLITREDVEVLRRHRTGVGSAFIEGYSQLVWRPK